MTACMYDTNICGVVPDLQATHLGYNLYIAGVNQ